MRERHALTEIDLTEPTWTLGDRLTKARKAAGLSGEEMARRLTVALERPVTKQTISNWENDHNQPRQLLSMVQAWAAQCPPAYTAEWLLRSRCISLAPAPGGQMELSFRDAADLVAV